MNKFPCPICGNESQGNPIDGVMVLQCPRCGEYAIGTLATHEINTWTKRQKANLSGWICENQMFELVTSNIEKLKHLRTPTVGEKAKKLLQFIADKFPKPGESIESDLLYPNADVLYRSAPRDSFVPWNKIVGVTWSLDQEESKFLVLEYLSREEAFLRIPENSFKFTITPKGWAQIESWRQPNSESKTAFIAMWFSREVKDAHLAIEKGIYDAGYQPFRVDQKEHNNDITDEIMAGIRGSKFMVADLTRHSNGVYYEAGFAKGLGLEVVWLCRETDKNDMHFDIRQLNCIFWEENKLDALSKALKNRIEATIGRGPLAPA